MGLLKIERQTLFSEVQGEVLLNGTPLAGVEVVQRCADGREWLHTVDTDKDGRFHFNKIKRTVMYPNIWFFPKSPVLISQLIMINYEGKEYKAWSYTKDDYEVGSELKGKPLYIVCDLTNEFNYFDPTPDVNSPHGIFRVKN